MEGTHHLQLHVELGGVESHAGRRGEHPIQEGKVRQAAVVGTAAVGHAHVQQLHHLLTDQGHDQAGAEKDPLGRPSGQRPGVLTYIYQ